MYSPDFQDVAGLLLDRLGSRLSTQDVDWFRSYLWAGEEGLLADELTQTLVVDQIPVDSVERDLLADLFGFFDPAMVDAATYPNICGRERALASLNVMEER